jgi:hypothetical protein
MLIGFVRFQVLTAASMMFRAVFWVVLPYNPEDSSEHLDRVCYPSLIFRNLHGFEDINVVYQG